MPLSTRLAFAAAALAAMSTPAFAAGSWQRTASGVVVTPDHGPEKAVRLEVYGDAAVRVTEAPTRTIDVAASLMVTAQPHGAFTVTQQAGHVLLKTQRLVADVDLGDGRVAIRDASGRPLVAESGPGSFAPISAEGKPFLAVRQQFNRGTDEGLYGLGQHQNAQMNYRGEDVELAQHNMDVAIPFVVSTRNYGLLWDNSSITRFGNPKPYALVGADDLKVTGEHGASGFTARYWLGGKPALTRQEATIDYQYIRDQAKWPAEAKPPAGAQGPAARQRVVWTGTIHPTQSGPHKFELYASSYFKLFVDGKPVLDRWRQNWNPWYHNFEVRLTVGRPAEIRIEWEPDGGYMALFHNDPQVPADRNSLSFASELAHAVDYYVVAGDDMDGVVAGYRALTGKALLLPRWAYGFWQSRQRYETQDQLVGVVEQYRRRGLPLDNIVQDWFYWPEDQWGSHLFDKARYPDPKGMIERVHDLHAQLMISVWPKFYPNTDNYKELAARGHVYPGNLEMGNRDWVGPGYPNTDYDPYSAEARAIYWRQIKERLAVLGIDAWWMDAPEPDMHSNLSIEERKAIMTPTALGPGAAFFNSFPLVHAEGVAQGWHAFKPDVRSFILTRSAFGGLQRAGAAVWSGDVAARWDDLRNQISAGVNFSMSGIPNWTHDIGGFAVEERYSKQDPAALDEWRELNLRWFQFGAFSPLFRSHGEFPHREIYEIAPAGPAMERSMGYYDRLRYRLLPYIYTLAADTWFADGTIMRGLVMDFPADRAAWGINDEYLFGHELLVAPVTAFKARTRSVYLPAGAGWYDFYSGRAYAGGQRIEADASYERIPLFVRAGSILPIGPALQYAAEKPEDPITLNVYTGVNGSFSLYEDDGTSLGYQSGAFSRIPIRWDERAKTLTIGARQGSFSGILRTRTFRIRWITPGRPLDLDRSDHEIRYSGGALTIHQN
ncbi:MAG TPA: TIM-barrel domain-containing protein [Allosphingosinicella sp.]|jgi:alpha-D-xyloside xylohydrolase|nr:TIM-barrel domain-containing protein [Allosphingosinicella sp.]